jgi:pimeloyl-ACP methyl ester carboxylesterase
VGTVEINDVRRARSRRPRGVEVPELSSNGITLHYEDTGGDGRPVVLIHGWPLSGASWSEQVGPLTEAGHRVITYDRRGFGDSEKPESGYDYDTFAADLAGLLDGLDLTDVSLVGFSMGGGEIARYIGKYGEDRLRSVVFAGAVPPYLLKTEDNPDGGLGDEDVEGMKQGARENREEFLDGFTTNFFSADGELKVTEEQRQRALQLESVARDEAVVGCIEAFGRTDFRNDLSRVTVPTLVIHGDSDAIVPFEVSGKRTAEAVSGSTLVVVEGGPHGFNVSHADEFNRSLVDFLA